jgi:hypothetical protein
MQLLQLNTITRFEFTKCKCKMLYKIYNPYILPIQTFYLIITYIYLIVHKLFLLYYTPTLLNIKK